MESRMISIIVLVVIISIFGSLMAYFLHVGNKSTGNDYDIIKKLPGQPHVRFKQHAGYLTVGENNLFYYFVESESDPSSKPLVIWLGGGTAPGFSSVGFGAFYEHGPFRPNGIGGLRRNKYSWNKEANMLYLEPVAGVGFSYHANMSLNESIDTISDNTTANMQLFLEKWLSKYPEYEKSNLFIAGESFAGYFVPKLAEGILKSKLKSNLKGILLGNPILDLEKDSNAIVDFLRSHMLISPESLKILDGNCTYLYMRMHSRIRGFYNTTCGIAFIKFGAAYSGVVNFIDISKDRYACPPNHVMPPHNSIYAGRIEMYLDIDPCLNIKVDDYLNRSDVQMALHAKVGDFTLYNDQVSFVRWYKDIDVSMLPILKTLIYSGIRIFVYSGDQSVIAPSMGTFSLISQLANQLELNITQPYAGWALDGMLGGWMELYGKLLSFVDIRGAGLDVSYTQPDKSLELFRRFLQDEPPQLLIE